MAIGNNLNNNKILQEAIEVAEKVFPFLQPHCVAIYLGGSVCEGIIEDNHDLDFICFSRTPVEMCRIRQCLGKYIAHNDVPAECDFIQIRNTQKEEQDYGSYINKKMIKLVGEDISFEFDVIDTHREKYKQILIDTVNKLLTGEIKNQKRWYQILRGAYILANNSYDLTVEQKREINILHDTADGWEEIRNKTIELIHTLV